MEEDGARTKDSFSENGGGGGGGGGGGEGVAEEQRGGGADAGAERVRNLLYHHLRHHQQPHRQRLHNHYQQQQSRSEEESTHKRASAELEQNNEEEEEEAEQREEDKRGGGGTRDEGAADLQRRREFYQQAEAFKRRRLSLPATGLSLHPSSMGASGFGGAHPAMSVVPRQGQLVSTGGGGPPVGGMVPPPLMPWKPVTNPSKLVGPTSQTVLRRFHLDSVVKLFVVSTEPNYSMPWQMKKQRHSTSSGFVIAGRRLLTNAHAVAYQTSIMIRRHGDARKYAAQVVAVGHECDLALLTVQEDSFWDGLKPLQFGGVPHLQEAVTVVGYPTGGDNISVTTGIVSRVDMTTYSHSGMKLLAIQIDAAINSGNSGGPAFNKTLDSVVGVAFETLLDAENIGYIIPTFVIQHFLGDIEKNDTFLGFCDYGITAQTTENPQLKQYMHLNNARAGILINRVAPLAPIAKVAQKTDIILKVDDVEIADDGTIPFRDGERISFRYILMSKHKGDNLRLTLWRDAKEVEVSIQMEPIRHLVPIHQYDEMPSYFTVAGLVFVPLSRPYLRHQWGKHWNRKAPVSLVSHALSGELESPDQQIVVLSQVLVAEINRGYVPLTNIQLLQFNGQKVKNLKHFAEMVECCEEEYLRFDLEYDRIIVMEREKAKQASIEILRQHYIPSAKSPDLITP
ncbi:Protease Do-like 10, mitochondrial [Balamuthia mandrillaris]